MANGPLRIGCVPYANAYPLWRGLNREMIFAPPATLYRMMENGACDVALLPSIALHRHPDWRILSKTCIASQGPVMSVKLFHRRPLSECRRIALDPHSMSSNAMLELLLRRHIGLDGARFELPVVRGKDACRGADAFLLIGDDALSARYEGWSEFDLGAAWQEWTGLPFVYAVWLQLSDGNGDVEGDRYDALARELEERASHALAAIDTWLPEVTLRFPDAPELMRRYFTQALSYELTPLHREGLTYFLDHLN